MNSMFGTFLCALLALSMGTAQAQRGTITIPVNAEVTVPAGAQICADTIIVYGTLTCASTDCLCPGTKVLCIGTVTPVELCSGGPVITAQQNLDFGNVLAGSGDTLILVVQNTGNLPLLISGMSVAPAGTPFTIISGGGAQTVPAGGSIQISIRFQPGTAGSFSGTLTIQNNSTVPAFDVALNGTGVVAGPIITLSTPSIDFGRTRIAQQAIVTMTVRNTGTAALQVTGQRITGGDSAQFTITETCSATIAANQSDDVTLRFTPAGRGVKSTTLRFLSNGGDAAVTLTGTGTGPAITASPSPVDFGAVQTGSALVRTVTVSNSGEGTLAINAQTITGSNASEFTLQKQSASSIDSGRNETIEVRFAPTTTGAKNATLTIASNDVGRPTVQIALMGSGGTSTGPRIVVASSLEFGNVAPGTSVTKDVVIQNGGGAVLSITAQTASGAGFTLDQLASTSIAVGASSVAKLRFSPVATQDYTGSFTIASTDPSAPSTVVSLHGSCGNSGSRIDVSRTIVDFGRVQVGAAKDEDVVVTNIGGSPLVISRQVIAGRDSLEFSVQQPAGSPLAPNASSTITVRLHPATAGVKLAKLTIESNDPGMPRYEIGLMADVVLEVERTTQVPEGIRLRQNYPNPFNPSTTVEYELDRAADVRLAVYNVYGELACTLDEQRREPGVYRVTWNAGGLPSGMYIAMLTTSGGGTRSVQRIGMILAK